MSGCPYLNPIQAVQQLMGQFALRPVVLVEEVGDGEGVLQAFVVGVEERGAIGLRG